LAYFPPDVTQSTSPFVRHEPSGERVPIVVDSPHSGMTWPAAWAPQAPRAAILTTWDAFVDELWGDAPAAGATLLAATFPRAFIDTNRADTDIDPRVIAGAWPSPLAPTAYSERGMGLIRRDALPGVPMYDAPLPVADVEARLRDFYSATRPAREG
jgi:N-formylglutamate deformylase